MVKFFGYDITKGNSLMSRTDNVPVSEGEVNALRDMLRNGLDRLDAGTSSVSASLIAAAHCLISSAETGGSQPVPNERGLEALQNVLDREVGFLAHMKTSFSMLFYGLGGLIVYPVVYLCSFIGDTLTSCWNWCKSFFVASEPQVVNEPEIVPTDGKKWMLGIRNPFRRK